MIRLIASDLDGTLLQKDGTLPPETFSVIRQLKEKNILFCAASGRQYANLRRLFAPVAEEMCFIAENGSCVATHNGQTVNYIPSSISEGIIHDIIDSGMQLLLSTPESSMLLDSADRSFTDDMFYRLRNTCTIITDYSLYIERYNKISGFHPNGIENLAKSLIPKWSPFLHADIAGKNWLDFTCTNKADGIRILSEQLNIPASDIAAFGDQFNDLAMLNAVGHPYLMETAPNELKFHSFTPCKNVIETIKTFLE
ncbi:MAG: HAD-IIB family hydrolase [Clostridia bacterium]|nr:HAD-IIB family hydrolase [Clostridia bacterium]